jgi:polyisoprenoid-binding protein YceI
VRACRASAICGSLLAAFAAGGFARAAESPDVPGWCAVAADSRLGFVASWEGDEFSGRFVRFDTRIVFDPGRPELGRMDVTIDITSADSGNRMRDEAMADPEWFDFAQHPTARYVAERIERGEEGYKALGMLELKGFTKEVPLEFRWEQREEEARLRGRAQLVRTDFGVGKGEWSSGEVIGLDVRVEVDLRLQHCGDAGRAR